jgi:ABC-2 type transport system permease protein
MTGGDKSVGRGVIHDIGYARYAGERRPPSTLWRVIMRHHLSYGWKTLWRFKPWMMSAIGITLVAGVVMYVSQNALFEGMRQRGAPLKFLDGIVPFAFRFYVMAAFLLTMTVGAAVVARDEETGAFTFYFSRPVRPRDYVIGRLAGMAILTAIILAAGPVLLTLFRIGLSRTTSEAIELIPWVGRALFVGLLGAFAYAALPLAISAMAGKRTIALGAWAAWYVVVTSILVGISRVTWGPLAAVDIAASVMSLAFGLWDIDFLANEMQVPLSAAIVSLTVQIGLAVYLFHRQITRTAAGAVGGNS